MFPLHDRGIEGSDIKTPSRYILKISDGILLGLLLSSSLNSVPNWTQSFRIASFVKIRKFLKSRLLYFVKTEKKTRIDLHANVTGGGVFQQLRISKFSQGVNNFYYVYI